MNLAPEWRRICDENERMRAALKQIADRRADLAAASRNDYDTGYSLATEMCCDIADEALSPAQGGSGGEGR